MIMSQTPGASRTSHGGWGDLAMSSLIQVSGASIFWLWAIHLATPRAMPIIPRVMMNGTSRQPGDQDAVDEADEASGQDAEEDRRQGGTPALIGEGGDDARQGDVRGGRQVDAAADDDERHA